MPPRSKSTEGARSRSKKTRSRSRSRTTKRRSRKAQRGGGIDARGIPESAVIISKTLEKGEGGVELNA